MTLESQVPRTVITGNGTRGPYSLVDASSQAIRFVSTSHVRLLRYTSTTDEVGTQLVENTDYTIGGTQDARTFTLTAAQAVLASTERIVADRNQSYTQDLSLSNGGSFGAVALMNRLDKFGEYLQELKAQVARKVEASPLDSTPSTIPLKANASEGDLLVYDADKNLIPVDPTDIDINVALLGSGWSSVLQLPAAGILDNLSGVRFVATYAALTALTTATGLSDNSIYYTYARATEEDGGAGFWRYDSGSSSTADGGTILAIDGGGAGRFFRLYEGAVDPRWFGAVTGDTGDSTSALTTAMDDFYATTHPVGVVRQATAITLNNATPGKRIQGNGARRSILKRTTAITQIAIQTDDVKIQDIGFQGEGSAISDKVAILVENANATASARSGVSLLDLNFYDQSGADVEFTGGNQGILNSRWGGYYSTGGLRYGHFIFKGVDGLFPRDAIISEDGAAAITGDDGTSGDAYVSSITSITQANPCVVTKAGHDVEVGDYVYCYGIGGMTELNENTYLVTAADASTFTLQVDASGFSAYTSGGYMTTLRPPRNIVFPPLLARRMGSSNIGPGEAVYGFSGLKNAYFPIVILEDCGFDDITDLSTQTGNYGMLFNSGQDGLHRCENIRIGLLIDRRSSNNTIVLAGVKNFQIDEIIADNTWRRSSDPGGDTAVIRLTDDAASNSCENVRIGSGRIVKVDTQCRIDAFIENECAAATGIDVNWANIDVSGVTRYTENGATTFAVRFPAFKAHKNGSAQGSIANSTVTQVTFGTESYDRGGYYDTSTSRWTPPAGIVNLTATVRVNSGIVAGAQVIVYIYKDGVELCRSVIYAGANDDGHTHINCHDLSTGSNAYDVRISLITGSSGQIQGEAVVTWFEGAMVKWEK